MGGGGGGSFVTNFDEQYVLCDVAAVFAIAVTFFFMRLLSTYIAFSCCFYDRSPRIIISYVSGRHIEIETETQSGSSFSLGGKSSVMRTGTAPFSGTRSPLAHAAYGEQFALLLCHVVN
jgi:hypothetical protein